MTAYGTIDTAIKSMKMGALEYILKPLKEPEELKHAIRKAYERRRLIIENIALKSELLKGLLRWRFSLQAWKKCWKRSML